MFDSSGEMTPPCGVPLASSSLICPSSITPAREPLPHQLEHPPVRDASRDELHQLVVVDAAEVVLDVGVEHVITAFGSRAYAGAPAPASHPASAESRTSTDEKSASKIGSSTSFAAICTTRSRTVGMPKRTLSSVGFRDVPPQDRLRPIRACAQLGLELLQEELDTVPPRHRRSTDHRRPPTPLLRFTRFHASHRTSLL